MCADALHICRLDGLAEVLRYPVRVPRLAVLAGEDVARDLPCRTPLEAFSGLLSLPRKRVDSTRHEEEDAWKAMRAGSPSPAPGLGRPPRAGGAAPAGAAPQDAPSQGANESLSETRLPCSLM